MPLARLKELNTTQCLWTYILRILSDGPSHAYTIRAEIDGRFGFRPGVMTAYKVLYLLERKKYVSRAVQGRKKVYTITPAGSKALREAALYYRGLAKQLS